MTKPKIIKLFKKYFEKRDDVVLSFLFGSVSKEKSGLLSDIDIAVYLKNEEDELKIWCDIEKIVGKEVDLLVLNRAFPIIAWEAIKGIPLTIKDRRLYLDLILEFSREAEDLIERNIDMWKMKEAVKCQN